MRDKDHKCSATTVDRFAQVLADIFFNTGKQSFRTETATESIHLPPSTERIAGSFIESYLGLVQGIDVFEDEFEQGAGNVAHFLDELPVETVHGVVAVNYND